MFPNPQDALPLPLHPNLDKYKKLAKDLVKAWKSGDPNAIPAWTANWVETLVRLSGVTPAGNLPVRQERWIGLVQEFVRKRKPDGDGGQGALADAQFVIARAHGFASWPKLAKHLEGLSHAASPVSEFEAAADAIVNGEIEILRSLLQGNPGLVRARSAREHRATLLHYVSANGVESYRQRTPGNAIEMAAILLDANAKMDATADVYGARLTTLELVATSVHPERVGVQVGLMELLLQRGATIPPGTVIACLANGRGHAAEFLAGRGAQLNLEGAAGLGRLDMVQSFFQKNGTLNINAAKHEMERGFLWACQYGRDGVVRFLLEKDAGLLSFANPLGTGLHHAVSRGQMETVRLLIKLGASLETRNEYGGTPLGQALWSAVHGGEGVDYVPIIETLLDAGCKVAEGTVRWLEEQTEDSQAVKAAIAEVLLRRRV